MLVLSACDGSPDDGDGGGDGDGGSDTLVIGYVTPQSGALAPFGEADAFVVDQMTDYFAENPVELGGTGYDVEIVVKDTQSDSRRAGEVAGELINDDGADHLLQDDLADLGNWYLVIVGAVAIAITLLAPKGLWGLTGGRVSVLPTGYRVGRPGRATTEADGVRGRSSGVRRSIGGTPGHVGLDRARERRAVGG
ncbi:ABC transporter substrate-binding protein [Geodermatophilus sp. URMC 62]|uniref:ABC transporter substrate-binding protein n=1 Tax=Geodermatophilus sp. URMC 62 TaxID=3423414 RepID=UPI00406BEAFA